MIRPQPITSIRRVTKINPIAALRFVAIDFVFLYQKDCKDAGFLNFPL
jgi:hypothetical protein